VFTTELARKAGAHILEGSCAIQRAGAGSVGEKNVVDLVAGSNVKVEELVRRQIGPRTPISHRKVPFPRFNPAKGANENRTRCHRARSIVEVLLCRSRSPPTTHGCVEVLCCAPPPKNSHHAHVRSPPNQVTHLQLRSLTLVTPPSPTSMGPSHHHTTILHRCARRWDDVIPLCIYP